MEKYHENELLVNTSTGEKYVIVGINSESGIGAGSYVVKNYVSGNESMIYSGELFQYKYCGCAVKSGNFYVCTRSDNDEFEVGKTYMCDKDNYLVGNSGKSIFAVTESTQFRNWHIDDAKAGDVLKTYGYIFEVKEPVSNGEIESSRCIDSEGLSYPMMKFACYGHVRPATYIEKILLDKKYMYVNLETDDKETENKDSIINRIRKFFKKIF